MNIRSYAWNSEVCFLAGKRATTKAMLKEKPASASFEFFKDSKLKDATLSTHIPSNISTLTLSPEDPEALKKRRRRQREHNRRRRAKKVKPVYCGIIEIDQVEEEKQILGTPPDPFWNSCDLPIEDEKEVFTKFIEEEEAKAMAEQGEKLSPLKNKKVKKNNTDPMICKHCKQNKDDCHSKVYGDYCRDAVIEYHYDTKKAGEITDDLTAKRIYINKYNNASEWEGHKATGRLKGYIWKFPPLCMKQNSYDHILHWLNWIRKGKYIRRGEHIPYEFHDY